MWLKTFEIEGKIISPIELLVLLQANLNPGLQQPIDTSEMIHRLDEEIETWTPERGTIYPIIHRLTDQKLLKKIKGRPMKIRRTSQANAFLDDLVNSELLIEQFEATLSYLEAITKSVAGNDMLSTSTFLGKVDDVALRFQESITNIVSDAKKAEQDWTEIDVD